MAMDKDPSGRYLSAQHFEEDLLRFQQGQPIAARRATAVYRPSKFVQRHRTAVLMTCATLVVVICAIFFDSWQSRRAARRVNQIEALANSTISDMTEKLQQSSTSVETQAALFHSALQYLDKLRESSGNDPRVLLELARAYERVGDLEGSPFVADLGNSATALHSYQEALLHRTRSPCSTARRGKHKSIDRGVSAARQDGVFLGKPSRGRQPLPAVSFLDTRLLAAKSSGPDSQTPPGYELLRPWRG